jgi:hypothetical protein
MGTSCIRPDLVSDRIAKAWEEAGITGWRAFPVAVSDELEHEIDGDRIKGYVGLSITGRAGSFDLTKSQTVLKPNVPGTTMMRWARGLIFEEDSWDRSDVFLSGESLLVFGTERAVECLEALKATNVMITPAAEFEILIGAVQ